MWGISAELASIPLNWFQRPPEAVSQGIPSILVPHGIYHFPFPDPDVSFAGTWPRCCHTYIILTIPFLSVIQNMSCYSSILHLNLFTSSRQSKYHQPLFIKVAMTAMLSRSLRSYKNTKDVALLVFSEEPSPEDSEMSSNPSHTQYFRVSIRSLLV